MDLVLHIFSLLKQMGTILKSNKSIYTPMRTKFTMVQVGQGSGFLQKSSASERARKQKTQIGLTVENGKTRNTIVENGKTQAELTQDKSVFFNLHLLQLMHIIGLSPHFCLMLPNIPLDWPELDEREGGW